MNWIPVIINPSAGRKIPILALNQVFGDAGVRWSVEVTQGKGDGSLIARKLADRGADIVAVYGGDGTISEVATGLVGTQTALGILPGGTGNVLTYEFGIPQDFVTATRLLVSEHDIHKVDMGVIRYRKFLLRAGVGFEAMVVKHTPRQLKDRFGILAYGIGGLQALAESRPLRFRLELDGEAHQADGVICTIANAAHLGLPGLRLSLKIDIEDGLLDVFVFRRTDLKLIMQIISEGVASALGMGELQHWQVKQVKIRVDPPQSVQVDGDYLGMTPVEIRCLPRSLRIVVPKKVTLA
jgi:YegS/Rv2252/BmrU family lipid kinase